MMLLVDAGNSRLKWAMINEGKRSQQMAQDYSKHNADQLLIEQLSKKQVSKLIVVSVLGDQFAKKIQGYCRQYTIELSIIHSQLEAYGIKNSYEEPQRLGGDRFVGMIAAHHLRPDQHCITISCGTAVTIDAITAQGEHLGGLILPGLQQFSDRLIKKTALLTSEKTKKISLFANNTADALASGRIFGLVEAINGISSRMEGKLLKINHLEGKQQTMHSVQTIICGGDAETLHPYLSESVQREDDWLMQGLQVIADIKSERQT